MFKSINERIYVEAKYFLEKYSTVREVAKEYNISKSTVHKDLTSRLYHLDYDLFLQVKKILEYNKRVRHIRGGESTRKKFLKEY